MSPTNKRPAVFWEERGSWHYTDNDALAPKPDGTCYCGNSNPPYENTPRKDCANFQEYGFDCSGFTEKDVAMTRYLY